MYPIPALGRQGVCVCVRVGEGLAPGSRQHPQLQGESEASQDTQDPPPFYKMENSILVW